MAWRGSKSKGGGCEAWSAVELLIRCEEGAEAEADCEEAGTKLSLVRDTEPFVGLTADVASLFTPSSLFGATLGTRVQGAMVVVISVRGCGRGAHGCAWIEEVEGVHVGSLQIVTNLRRWGNSVPHTHPCCHTMEGAGKAEEVAKKADRRCSEFASLKDA